MINRLFSRLSWHFDRTFGDIHKWAKQIMVVLASLAIIIGVFTLLGYLLFDGYEKGSENPSILTQTIALIFNVSNLPPAHEMDDLPAWWQIIGIMIGAVVFTSFTITFVGNFLDNRIDAYKDGSARYYFEDHILFLGGSNMIPPMVRELYKKPDCRKKHFVILTSEEPKKVRRHIDGALTPEEKKTLKITVLRGYRDDKETLQSVYLDKAARIYIIGDSPFDPEHDSTNMACWNLAKELCCHRRNVPCFLLFRRASTTFLFRHRSDDTSLCLDTTVINRLESVAQRVLVHNGNENSQYPPLDRNGIGKDSERTVHFVLYGMTAVSYALSTTAAHLCHFPNFVTRNADGTFGENKEKRTKITLIAPNIKEEMSYLTTHLESLFKISKCTVYSDNWKFGDSPELIITPELKTIGDFLDIEWEFVNGNIADNNVRELLKQAYKDNENGKTYLTVAMCEDKADRNIAAALYLPSEFHQITMKEGSKDDVDYEKTIPILVYQPESEELLKTSSQEIAMFRNILPFGSVRESYDPFVRRRILEGKRINYIYFKGEEYSYMTSDIAKLDEMWRGTKYADQMSNIYCASHIGVKLRSVDNRAELTEEDIKLLAVTEHNRWNVEKLLMGFEALPEAERATQHTKEGLKDLKKKKEIFKHYCIAPYSQLLPNDCKYDTLIVKNLRDVVGE